MNFDSLNTDPRDVIDFFSFLPPAARARAFDPGVGADPLTLSAARRVRDLIDDLADQLDLTAEALERRSLRPLADVRLFDPPLDVPSTAPTARVYTGVQEILARVVPLEESHWGDGGPGTVLGVTCQGANAAAQRLAAVIDFADEYFGLPDQPSTLRAQ